MIKGINKRIIEINDTNNSYIEKAILIISPEASSVQQAKITNDVSEYFSGLIGSENGTMLFTPKKKRFRPSKKLLIGSALAVAGILTVIAVLFV